MKCVSRRCPLCGKITAGMKDMRNSGIRKKIVTAAVIITVMTCFAFLMSGCSIFDGEGAEGGARSSSSASADLSAVFSDAEPIDNSGAMDEESIPEYEGEPSAELNGGEPEFTAEEIEEAKKDGQAPSAGDRSVPSDDSVSTDGVSEAEALGEENLSPIDDLGRCGPVTACVSPDTMPEGERESIGMVRPSGWPEKISESKYDFIDGGYLYNRCHLIGWQLTGENAEERNLITGTRYMNVEGMLPYENIAADYVRTTGGSVLYRATPVFVGEELVARGVKLEALSVDDGGERVSFNVFCFNVQPDVEIDYMTGENHLAEGAAAVASAEDESAAQEKAEESAAQGEDAGQEDQNEEAAGSGEVRKYILNTNRKRYHLPSCSSVSQIKDKNRREYTGTAEELEAEGYRPCGNCHPDLR